MVSSDAETVEQYLAELSEDRGEMISTVRQRVLEILPAGFVERMNWGMICYEVPLEIEPDTYNGQPLMFTALASQKRHCSLYIMPVYQDPMKHARLLAAYKRLGRKPNMGKSCIRFTKVENIPLDVICELIADCDMDSFISVCQH